MSRAAFALVGFVAGDSLVWRDEGVLVVGDPPSWIHLGPRPLVGE
ncbi:MAG TPA: hypothetical protein VGD71_32495 [Kribbella sp.]